MLFKDAGKGMPNIVVTDSEEAGEVAIAGEIFDELAGPWDGSGGNKFFNICEWYVVRTDGSSMETSGSDGSNIFVEGGKVAEGVGGVCQLS